MLLLTLLGWIFRILSFYTYVLIARILMTWVPDVERTQLGRILARITDPYLNVFRRFIPPLPLGGGYIDLTPIIAILAWDYGVMNGLRIVFGWLLRI